MAHVKPTVDVSISTDCKTLTVTDTTPFTDDDDFSDRHLKVLANVANEPAVNLFDLGDTWHTHIDSGGSTCTETGVWATSDCCWFENTELGSKSANDVDEAEIRIRWALHNFSHVARRITYWLKRGNHDNSFGSSPSTCQHTGVDIVVSLQAQEDNLPNPNDVYPVSALE